MPGPGGPMNMPPGGNRPPGGNVGPNGGNLGNLFGGEGDPLKGGPQG